MTKKDFDLVVSAQGGDSDAYDSLAGRYRRCLAAICWSRTGGRGPVEDLVQEAVMRGFRSLAKLEDPEKFAPWLLRIASRACADWVRAQSRGEVSLDAIPESHLPGIPSPTGDIEAQETTTKLWKAIRALPEIYRETLVLFYYENLGYREISASLNVGESTVNARLTEARRMLRDSMRERNPTDSRI